MSNRFKTGVVGFLSALMLAGVGAACADNSSAPYRPQGQAPAQNKAGGCGYEDPMRGYRSPAPRYARDRWAPPPYPRYRPRPRYRESYRRGPYWDGMPWGGYRRGRSWGFGTDDMPWGKRRGRGRGFSFGSDDFGFGSDDMPWNGRRRGRGFNFNSRDFRPW